MTYLLDLCTQVLVEAGFSTNPAQYDRPPGLVFENDVVIGFVLFYETVEALSANWRQHQDALVSRYQFGLRKAGDKAWNTYIVLLCAEESNDSISILLGGIEEDLVGTRKICRANVKDTTDIRDALMPLLAIQNAPKLDAVDIAKEIRLRTTELGQRAVDAFLSEADVSVVLQVLEEGT